MTKLSDQLWSQYSGELCYTASRYFNPFIGLLTSGIAAAFILPEDLGALQSMLIIAPYFSFLHLGVFNGLNRNIAFYRAQEGHDKVQSMVDTSYTVAWLASAIGLIAGLGVLVSVIVRFEGTAQIWGAVSLCALLFFTPTTTHFDTTYRSGREFKRLGIIGFTEDFITALTGLLPILLGYVGKALSDISKAFVRYFLRWKYQPIRGHVRFSGVECRSLVAVGAPLLVGNYLTALLQVADQSLIAIRLGTEALGHYALSRMLLMAILIVPSSMAVLLYPRAAGLYGQAKNNRDMRPYFWKALLFNVAVLIPLCAVMFFLIPWVTHRFLPNYVPGITAAQINLLTCMTLISNGPSIIVGVVRRNAPMVMVRAFLLGLVWAIGLWVLPSDASLEAYAWLRFGVAFALSAFSLGYSFWLTTLDEYNE